MIEVNFGQKRPPANYNTYKNGILCNETMIGEGIEPWLHGCGCSLCYAIHRGWLEIPKNLASLRNEKGWR